MSDSRVLTLHYQLTLINASQFHTPESRLMGEMRG